MISDYINKVAVSKMTFDEFCEKLEGNIEIGRHKLTMKEAFIELGGTFKKVENTITFENKSKKKVKVVKD